VKVDLLHHHESLPCGRRVKSHDKNCRQIQIRDTGKLLLASVVQTLKMDKEVAKRQGSREPGRIDSCRIGLQWSNVHGHVDRWENPPSGESRMKRQRGTVDPGVKLEVVRMIKGLSVRHVSQSGSVIETTRPDSS
jgi:hypothetical protein